MIRILLLILVFSSLSFSQFSGKRFSIGINAVYTTTSKVYLSPNSSDEVVRNSFSELGEILNPAFEIKYQLTNAIILGIGTEYMKNVRQTRTLPGFTGIEVNDGFSMIPVEFSAYYLLPFSTEQFKFTMGGGGGFYFGEHIRDVADLNVSNVERKTAYGIHVIIGMDYLFRENISLHGEMKFRDPQFTLLSRYNKNTVVINNRRIAVPQEVFASKINIDGVTFLVGLAYHF